MMKKLVSLCVTFVMLVTMAMPAFVAQAEESSVKWDDLMTVPEDALDEENPDGYMAHNIYSDPDLSEANGKYNGFIIDFKADKAPTGTYWSLCNWQMCLDDLKSKYQYVEGAGAYAGLQMRDDGSKAIMAIWETTYGSSKDAAAIMNAQMVYPKGDTSSFAEEGEGSNYIDDYTWNAGNWYRMYINSWIDTDGKTYIEMWLNDLSMDEWNLICRFDTGLCNSCMMGNMSQFMENYIGDYSNFTRTFEYRNVNIRETTSDKWKPISTLRLSVDTCYGNKKGGAVFGATADRIYGITNGYGDDQFKPDEDVSGTYTIYPNSDVSIPVCEEHNYSLYVSNGNGTHRLICAQCKLPKKSSESIACSGGQATCESKAICSDCDGEYGSLSSHKYQIETIKATFDEYGERTISCTVCGDELDCQYISPIDTVKLSTTAYTYDGNRKRPSVQVYDDEGYTISTSNYTVNYPTASTNVGTYTVKVVFSNQYYGTKKLTYQIKPPKTAISSLSAKKKSFYVKWKKKTTQVSGYQIQYSRSKSFSGSNKTYTINSNKTNYKTIKNLAGGKRYYVRLRTYKVVNGKRYYSSWSSAKSVVTKK